LDNNLKSKKVPEWLRGFLSGWGITRWLQGLILRGGMVLLMIMIVITILPCFLKCIQGMTRWQYEQLHALIIESKKGEIVGTFYIKGGHDDLESFWTREK